MKQTVQHSKAGKRFFEGSLMAAFAGLLLWAMPAEAQGTYCVRAGATGSGNGSDWNNAYTSLPGTLQRGATYYVAGGSYPAYTFNTPESGTTVVMVKKASASNHGTDVGWTASYGASQAVFSTAFNITRGYFLIDGQYRNEDNWFDGTAYGFKIQHTGNWKNMEIRDPGALREVPNVTVKYIYIAGVVGALPEGGNANPIDTETYSSSIRNVNYVFSCLFVEGGQGPFFIRTLVSPIVEYCATSKTSGDSDHHGEVVNLFWSSPGVAVVRYNHFRDSYNGASGYPAGGGTAVIAISEAGGAEIYGNIFENYTVGDGAIAAGWDNNNIKVYNNTFVNGGPSSPTVLFPQSGYGHTGIGNGAYNNLAAGCAVVSYTGAGDFGNNSTENTLVFRNYAGRDYRLARRTTVTGTNVPAPYDVDMAGNMRGRDGVWDCGAFQYTNPRTNPVASIWPPALAFGLVQTNTSRDLVFTVQNTGAGSLAGIARVAPPFSIISGEAYHLAPHQSHLVTIRYRPLTTGSNSQTITFSGGGGASGVVNGVGAP